jgi:uncharacterized membrane protein YsdA (DUF1294 family)
MVLKILILYLVIMNVIGFWSMRDDKRKAKTRSRRTPEATLFTYALLGGSVGSLMGMYICRHKTKHLSFVLGLPIILVFNVLVIYLGYRYFG